MVLGAVLSVQLGAAVAKSLFPVVGPAGTVWLRLGLSALLLVVLTRPALRLLRGHAGRHVIAFGVSLGAMNWAFYEALARIPLGVAVTIEFVGPLTVAVATSRRRSDLPVVALAAVGIALLTRSSGTALDPVGVALALVAGGFWAAYILLSAKVGARLPGMHGLALALVVGTVLVAPAGVLSLGGIGASDGPGLWTVLAVGGLVALLSSLIPYSLELEALRRVPTSVFGVLLSLEPAAAAVAGLMVLNEQLLGRQWVAIVLVVIAAAVAALRSPVPAAVQPA